MRRWCGVAAVWLGGIAIMGLWGEGTITAQSAEVVLTLEEALTRAVARNIEVAQAEQQVRLQQTSVQQAQAAFLPDLTVSMNPTLRYDRSYDGVADAIGGEQGESLGLTASSSMLVYDGFARRSALKEANRAWEASTQRLSQTQERILFETAAQYLAVFQDEALVEVEEDNLLAEREQLEQIEAFYAAGNRPIADVLQQRAAIARSEQRLLVAQQAQAISTLMLKQLVRLDADATVRLVAPPEAMLAWEPVDEATPSMQTALATRRDVAAQRLRIEAAQAGVAGARAGYLPSVSVGLNAGTSYSSFNQALGFSDQFFNAGGTTSLSLSVALPLLDRRRTRSQVERAQVTLANEQLALEQDIQRIAFEVERAMLNYETTQAQLVAANEQVAAARQALQAVTARYDVGAATLVEVSDVRNAYREALADHVEIRFQVVIDRLAIAYQTGDVEGLLATLP